MIMETYPLPPGGLPPGEKHVECIYTPADATPEQRAEIEAALYKRIAAKFGERVADRIVPAGNPAVALELATPANPAPPRKKRRRRPKPKRSPARPPKEVGIAPHEARCTICSHPERIAIEEEFLHWANSWDIAHDYGVNRRAIYRHAHCFNLFALRNRKLRYALGFLVEEADRVKPTADAVLRAIHTFARVNDEGQWVEPPSHLVVSRGPSPAAPEAATPSFDVIDQPALPEPTAENPAVDLSAPLDTTGRTEYLVND